MKVILQALVFSLSVFLVLWMYWIRTITYSISYLELLQSNLPDFTTKEINKVAQHYRYLNYFGCITGVILLYIVRVTWLR